MESALDQKLDLSALHLGTISLGKLLGALLTLVICLIAVRLVLWVVTVLITADQLGIPVTSLVALCRCCPWPYPWRCRMSWPMWPGDWCCW